MGLLFLLMTIVKNDTMDLPDRKLFLHIWIFELLELTAYNLELVTASYDHPTNMRIFLSALGYSLRPLIPYILIKLIKRVEDKKIYEVLLIFPWVLAPHSLRISPTAMMHRMCSTEVRWATSAR